MPGPVPRSRERFRLDENAELVALRGLVSLVLGYVLLYTPDIEQAGLGLRFGAVAAHLASNALLLAGAPARLAKRWFLPALFLADLALVSWVLAAAASAETDLYLVFFLVVLMSGMQRDPRLSFVTGGIACVLYGVLWSKTSPLEELFGARVLLRFPFFFIVAFFSAVFARRAQRADEAAAAAARRLEQSRELASIGRLAGGIAHEFNNILTAILGHGAMLEQSLPADDELRRDARAIVDLGGRAARLVSLLLNFSRRQHVTARRLDLRSFLAEKDGALRGLLGAGVALSVELPSGLPAVVVDPDQLWQAVAALAANAREAAQDAGRFAVSAEAVAPADLPPTVSRDGREGFVALSFADDGPGIAPELMDALFQPFLSTKPPGGGVGLSLASAYGIARRAGGDLRAETTPGRGTTFRLLLPATAAKVPAASGTRGF